jgi:hypothetical protein
MDYNQAIALMKTSSNINDWNIKREQVKEAFNIKTKAVGAFEGVLVSDIKDFLASPIPFIDSSGLICKTLTT